MVVHRYRISLANYITGSKQLIKVKDKAIQNYCTATSNFKFFIDKS
jgi:hypothetical protein